MGTNPRPRWTLRWLAIAGLLAALASPQAWAVGGGSPDPSTTPVLQALQTQVDDLGRRFLTLTGVIERTRLPRLKQPTDELARIDYALPAAMVPPSTNL